MLYILTCLTFHVLSKFFAKFLVLSRFSHFFGQIPGYFCTWTDKIQISRFSRFPGSTMNPVLNGEPVYGWFTTICKTEDATANYRDLITLMVSAKWLSHQVKMVYALFSTFYDLMHHIECITVDIISLFLQWLGLSINLLIWNNWLKGSEPLVLTEKILLFHTKMYRSHWYWSRTYCVVMKRTWAIGLTAYGT